MMDDHTWKDLEIFQARGAGRTVHDLLSVTRTTGGSRVLRQRMERPPSSAHRIREVQDSVKYIIAHRRSFDCLPSEVVVHGVVEYLNGGLPSVRSTNPFLAFIEAMTVRLEFRFFWRLTEGVLRTTKMVRGLQRVLDPAAFPSPVPGELGPILDELRRILSRESFEELPTLDRWELPTRKIFKLDRGYRSDHGDEVLRALLRLVYQLDALVAMSDATSQHGMVIPELLDGPATLEADGLVNLFLTNPVPVNIRLDPNHHLLFLTGPNMAGKSTFLRSLGVALYLAHLGMGVPAKGFRFTPSQSLLTALNMSDDIHGGISYFRAEAIRMKAVADELRAGRRIVALVDEPFKGTNVKDAMDASWLVLQAFAKAEDCLFAVSSHLIELADTLLATDKVVCGRFEASERENGLDFDFTLRSGVSTQRLGMRVLELEGLVALLRGEAEHLRRA
jgi:DNA mismatch repair ATPase MutS